MSALASLGDRLGWELLRAAATKVFSAWARNNALIPSTVSRLRGAYGLWGGLLAIGLIVVAATLHSNRAARSVLARRPAAKPPIVPVAIDSSPLLIRATAHDFRWQFTYAGPDRQLDTPDDRAMNAELRLPVDRDVELRVTSTDFVYTFLVPQLGLRRIAVPELTYSLEFHPAVPGRFAIEADPMCRVRIYHDGPMGYLIVESGAEFDAWYHGRSPEVLP